MLGDFSMFQPQRIGSGLIPTITKPLNDIVGTPMEESGIERLLKNVNSMPTRRENLYVAKSPKKGMKYGI